MNRLTPVIFLTIACICAQAQAVSPAEAEPGELRWQRVAYDDAGAAGQHPGTDDQSLRSCS